MATGAGALRAAKKDLRQSMKSILSNVSPESVELQSRNVAEVLFSLPEYKAARRISIYLAMPSGEISTSVIVVNALREGKKVFVPYLHTPGATASGNQTKTMMDMLALHSLEDYEALKADKWGIPSLDPHSIRGRENCLGHMGRRPEDQVGVEKGPGGLDLILMPGVAFDRNLRRLGHGRGFYDSFLQRYRDGKDRSYAARMPLRVGLSLKEQLLQQGQAIPTDDHDWPLTGLIVGDRQYIRP